MAKTGVLLVNLGTPDSPAAGDVFRYLNEFLTDRRVIDIPWLWRQLLVRLFVVPRRFRQSARLYRRIWEENGSPLLLHSEGMQQQLQTALGEDYAVELGMRYQKPSIAQGLKRLQQQGLKRLVILPLFPQYASATTGSVQECVMKTLSRWQVIPETHFVHSYYSHPLFIEAFYQRGQSCQPERFDHIVFSFHGLPEKQLRKADRLNHCLQSSTCCENRQQASLGCYRSQCLATAKALAHKFAFGPERYSICFQSRLGKDRWTQPYAEDTIHRLATKGHKKLLVFAPAFTCDCLETIDEIGREYAELFQRCGGEELQLVPSLNTHPMWIQCLQELIGLRLPP